MSSDKCECGFYDRDRHHTKIGGGECDFMAYRKRIAELEQRLVKRDYENRLLNEDLTTEREQLAALLEAAGELVANAEWDGDISAVDTDDLKALRATLLQEPPHD